MDAPNIRTWEEGSKHLSGYVSVQGFLVVSRALNPLVYLKETR